MLLNFCVKSEAKSPSSQNQLAACQPARIHCLREEFLQAVMTGLIKLYLSFCTLPGTPHVCSNGYSKAQGCTEVCTSHAYSESLQNAALLVELWRFAMGAVGKKQSAGLGASL